MSRCREAPGGVSVRGVAFMFSQFFRATCPQCAYQDVEKRGLSFRGLAVTTGTATTAETAKHGQNRHSRLLALYFVGQVKGGQGALQNRQNRHKTAKTAMKATPLKLNPLFRHPDQLILQNTGQTSNNDNLVGHEQQPPPLIMMFHYLPCHMPSLRNFPLVYWQRQSLSSSWLRGVDPWGAHSYQRAPDPPECANPSPPASGLCQFGCVLSQTTLRRLWLFLGDGFFTTTGADA